MLMELKQKCWYNTTRDWVGQWNLWLPSNIKGSKQVYPSVEPKATSTHAGNMAKGRRIFDMKSHCTVITKPIGKVLTGPRLNGKKWKCNSWWDLMKIGAFEQNMCQVVASPFLKFWLIGKLPLPNLVIQEAGKSTLRSVLLGDGKWELVQLPEPTQVVNLK